MTANKNDIHLFFYGLKDDVDVVKAYFIDFFKDEFIIVDSVDKADFIVIVGGDGCLLNRSIKEKVININYNVKRKPVLKVHYRSNSEKSLGYTMDIHIDNLVTALTDIREGKYYLQSVRLLQVDINGMKYYALNDIANCSAILNSTIITKVIIDNDKNKMPTPRCTGVIVSTGYGSSAWNLSTNGAVVISDTFECMLLGYRESPIKPDHFIVPPDSIIQLSCKRETVLTIDGENIPVYAGAVVKVTLSNSNINMVRTDNTYESVVQKLARLAKFNYEEAN